MEQAASIFFFPSLLALTKKKEVKRTGKEKDANIMS